MKDLVLILTFRGDLLRLAEGAYDYTPYCLLSAYLPILLSCSDYLLSTNDLRSIHTWEKHLWLWRLVLLCSF